MSTAGWLAIFIPVWLGLGWFYYDTCRRYGGKGKDES